MNNIFNIGDLVRLHYSDHIGIVIESADSWKDGKVLTPYWSYRIKWAVGEPYTWEIFENLRLIAGINDERTQISTI